MRKFTLFLLAIALSTVSFAQEKVGEKCTMSCCKPPKEKKPSKKGWITGGSFMLLGSQGGSKNWAPGAERFSMAANSFLTLWAKHSKGRNNWTTILTAQYGLVKTTNGGFKKNDDKVDLYSKWVRDGKRSKISGLGIVAGFRSQITDGFNYDFDQTGVLPFSSWFAPAYVTVAPGIDLHNKSKKGWELFISPIAYRAVIVDNRAYTIRNNMALANGSGVVDPQTGFVTAANNKQSEFNNTLPYGVNPAQKARHEVGTYVNLNYKCHAMSNVTYSTRLDLFANFINSDVVPNKEMTFGQRLRDGKPGNIDVYWTNMITMRVNRFLSVVYSFDLVYDDNTRNFTYSHNKADLQVKSILGVGLAAKF